MLFYVLYIYIFFFLNVEEEEAQCAAALQHAQYEADALEQRRHTSATTSNFYSHSLKNGHSLEPWGTDHESCKSSKIIRKSP